MIRIWGRTTSSNVMKVLWLLDELGVDHERIDAGGAFGRTDTPEYRAMNPPGLVPTLEENGFSLFESNAILRYVCNAYAPGSDWYPTAPRARAAVDAWLDVQQTLLTGPAGRVFIGLVRTPPEKRDPAAIAAATVEAGRAWAIVAAKLAGRDFLFGPKPSIADIAFGVNVHRWFALPIERPDLPALRGWYERLLTRPPYATHCAQPLR
jgi:glutathione S-transferase